MRTIPHRWSFTGLLAWAMTAMAVSTLHADPRMDWTSWRGPEHNGVSREVGLVDSWSPEGENLLWVREDLGTISTPIVMDGRMYVLARADEGTDIEGERVVCVDAATGKTIWEHKFNVFLSDVPAERVGWSSVVGDPETGNVYALGVCNLFMCLDGKTGKVVWERSMSEEFGMLNTYGGRTNVPIIFEDLVIISGVTIGWGDMARPSHRFLGMNKKTGEVVWYSSTSPLPDDTTYSTPTLAVINGQRMMVFGAGDGDVWAFQPRTGKPIWQYKFSRRGLNVTPLVVGNTVYTGQSEENLDDNTMGALVAIDGTKTGDVTQSAEIWRVKEVMVGKSSPIFVDDRLYAVDDGAGLFVVDPKTGKTLHKQKLGAMMRSSLLYADGKVYACDAAGRWYIFKPDGDKVKIIHRLRLRSTGCFGSPIVSHGRIYLPTTSALYCIGKEGHEPKLGEVPPAPEEDPVSADPTPAQLLLSPAETLVKPGEQVKYTVKLFNSKGQFLKEVEDAEFSVDDFAQIDGKGVLTTSKDAKHVACNVTAKVGDLMATARVRIVPSLPWKFDFADGQIPITWNGARYRHVPRAIDGDYVMVKVTTIPKGTRSQSWMGHTDFHDYSIQADVQAQPGTDKLPDIGMICQRYTLDMMGASQKLQVRTWPPQLRMAKTIPFEWKAGVWYTMKLQASNEGDVAVVRAKVWERDKPEPKEWAIEATDKFPNRNGSPGLYGNATNAEIFIDNIAVTPNK